MSEECFSKDEEMFNYVNEREIIYDTISNFKNPEDAIGTPYWKGIANKPKPSSFFNMGELMDNMYESAWGDFHDNAEDFLNDFTEEKEKELNKLISDWLDANVNVSFYSVDASVECKITEEMVKEYKEK